MEYRAFDSFHTGFSHRKKDLDCEDRSLSYNDDFGRYYIAVTCDGHSDKNCFRSSRGAQFGCEAAKEMIGSFFETYLNEEMSFSDLPGNAAERLKQSIKQCWDNKVSEDLNEDPVTDEDLSPLSERVREYYKSGKGLKNIYGATFLAAGICKDLFIVMHIGDGIIMCISPDGIYMEPLEYDEKSDMGEPASLCDEDLFTRDKAFRCVISANIPSAVILSSDGIGDSVDDIQYRELIYTVLSKLSSMEDSERKIIVLDPEQQKYLDSFVAYYAAEGNGVEDDCSFAGIYSPDKEIPKVALPLEYASRLYKNTADEFNSVIEDYEKRKKGVLNSIDEAANKAASALRGSGSASVWAETKGKIEDLKSILRAIVENEAKKKAAFEKRLDSCREYIIRAGGTVKEVNIIPVSDVDESYLAEDKEYQKFISLREENRKKQTAKDTEAETETVEKQTASDEDQTDPGENQTETGEKQTASDEDQAESVEKQTESDEKQTGSEEEQTESEEEQTESEENQTEPEENQTESEENQTEPEENQMTSGEEQAAAGDPAEKTKEAVFDDTDDQTDAPDVKLIPIGNDNIDGQDSKQKAESSFTEGEKKNGRLKKFFSKFTNDQK
ncbi:MAG: protein phosphatase 2C domain-containing protein [Lachnospiraceae bacterium]|nr:protein phosphatase 2C domain-containing protein [Lachnospiraceae bacterium]